MSYEQLFLPALEPSQAEQPKENIIKAREESTENASGKRDKYLQCSAVSKV